MRIVQYLSRFRSQDGGVPRAVLDLAALLSRRGHEVVVVCGGAELVPTTWARGMREDSRAPEPLATSSVSSSPVRSRSDRSVSEGSKLAPRVLELSPWSTLGRTRAADRRAIDEVVAWSDVLHLHVPWDRRHRHFAAAARRVGRRYVITPHGMLDRWTVSHRGLRKRLFLALGGRRVLEEAALVQCNSTSEARQSRESAPNSRFVVAPLAVDLDACHSIPDRRPEDFARRPARLLALGRLDPIKGIEDAFAALARLGSRGIAATLDIAGDGPAEYVAELRERARREEVAVRFHGHVSGDAKRSLLESADLFVHPSYHENFGVALVEAMAAGVPVVTTTGVNIAGELVDSGGAVAVAPGEPHAFAAAIEAMLADGDELRRRGAAGRAWTRRVLAPDAIGAAYEAIYRRVIDGSGPGADV